MQRLITLAIAICLLFVGCQTLSSTRGRMQLLSLLGAEVPGLDTSLADIPNQYTTDGQPQVLVYGPTNCGPTSRTVAALAQQNIPHLFRDSNAISQDELGAVILSIPRNAPGGTPLVLVNGKILVAPTPQDIVAEYERMSPRT